MKTTATSNDTKTTENGFDPFAGLAAPVKPEKKTTPVVEKKTIEEIVSTAKDVLIRRYNHVDLFCVGVIQMKLHERLSVMIPRSYFNEVALGDYTRFWKMCDSVQGPLNAAIAVADPGYRYDLEVLSRALRLAYVKGLTGDACLMVYAVLNGTLSPARYSGEFNAECLAMSKVNANPPEGSNVTLEEALFEFEAGPFAEFRERLEDSERKHQVWYASRNQ